MYGTSTRLGDRGKTEEGWQDISTAPKDRPVLLTGPGGQIGVCVWGGRWLYYGLPNKAADWLDEPTHWQPLPEPAARQRSALRAMGGDTGYQQAMAEARAALRLIRETMETLGPVGAMASEEATNRLRGPTLMDEAEEIVAAIQRWASTQSNR